MNNKKSYELLSFLLREQQVDIEVPEEEASMQPEDIKRDPHLLKIKKKAAEISAKAELERSKNEMQKAKIERQKIEAEAQQAQAEAENETRYPNEANLDSGDPINKKKGNGTQESLNEQPFSPDEDDDLARLAPGNEDVVADPDTDISLNEEDEEDLSQLPADAEDPVSEDEQPEEEPQVEIAGMVPQTKDEAEIARIQARTREIQTKIGEYTPPGAEGMDEEGMDDGMDDGMGGEGMDDGMGGEMGAEGNIDPMTGMPVEEPGPPDPMKGFGDTTDPAAQSDLMMGGMGMGGVDPMTGQPIDDGPSKTPTASGRLYMLKKIYFRLALLDNILTNCPDPEVMTMREDIREAFSIFKLIVHNLKSFKDKADSIIVDYYLLIRDATRNLETHFKQRRMQSEEL